MDRVRNSARGEDRRAQDSPSVRRTSHAGSRTSSVPPRTGQYKPTSTPAQRVSEDRYRPGGRRTTAEPLRASWKPHDEDVEKKPARRPSRTADSSGSAALGKFAKTYGWRVYAVPILIVLTVLVVFNTATGPAEPIVSDQQTQAAALGSDGVGGGPSDGGTDVIPENPAKPVDLNIPTAELPDGIPFTQAGQGTFRVIPGKGDKVGTGGKLFTYTVDVENGIDPGSYAGDDSFAAAVQTTLSSPQSWTYNGKFTLQRVDASFPNPSFRVSLTTPETTHRADMCGYQIKAEASCYRRSEGRVLINLARWVRGAKAFSGDLGLYRQYAINHEVGHALGGQHVGCPVDGGPAPVMMQQSFGVADDYVSQLNDVPGGDKGKVAKDGKVCRPNAWPNTGGN